MTMPTADSRETSWSSYRCARGSASRAAAIASLVALTRSSACWKTFRIVSLLRSTGSGQVTTSGLRTPSPCRIVSRSAAWRARSGLIPGRLTGAGWLAGEVAAGGEPPPSRPPSPNHCASGVHARRFCAAQACSRLISRGASTVA